MNDQVFELIKLLLEKEPPSKERTEIIRFYLLPRNTPVKPVIEWPDEEIQQTVGSVERPDADTLFDKEHPDIKAEKDAMKVTLKGIVNK